MEGKQYSFLHKCTEVSDVQSFIIIIITSSKNIVIFYDNITHTLANVFALINTFEWVTNLISILWFCTLQLGGFSKQWQINDFKST